MNSVAEQFQQFRMDGNIVPHSWYQAPRLAQKNGKPNLVAVTLLADVVYWYRPAEIRDETSGAHLGYRQKFGADKLQKNYRKWGDGFGFTLRQVEDAMAFLKAAGLLTVERRNVVTELGTFPNCAFIEPVFEAIREITYPEDDKKGGGAGAKTSPVKTGDPSRSGGRTSPVPARGPSPSGAPHGTPEGEHSKTPPGNSKKTPSGKAPGGASGVLPSAASERKEEERRERAERTTLAAAFAALTPAQQRVHLDHAEQELVALHAGTGIKPKAKLIEQRALNLYAVALKGGQSTTPA